MGPEGSHAESAESRISRLDSISPTLGPPTGNYVRAVRTGNLIFLSGHLPDTGGAPVHTGKVGRDLSTEQGYQAARQATACLLTTLREEVGDLNKVTRVVKLFGMVNSDEDFGEQHHVINGASDLLEEIFGPIGVHARSAVGMAQLPRNNCVEIEAIVEIESD